MCMTRGRPAGPRHGFSAGPRPDGEARPRRMARPLVADGPHLSKPRQALSSWHPILQHRLHLSAYQRGACTRPREHPDHWFTS